EPFQLFLVPAIERQRNEAIDQLARAQPLQLAPKCDSRSGRLSWKTIHQESPLTAVLYAGCCNHGCNCSPRSASMQSLVPDDLKGRLMALAFGSKGPFFS